MDLNVLGVDTETGGLKTGVHSLLQVALVAYKDGEVVDTLDLFVRDEEYVVTAKAMEINGLQLGQVYDNGVRPDVAVGAITDFSKRNFGGELPILLGHNVGFDKGFLNNLFESQGEDMDEFISHRSIDTMSIIWVLHDLGLIPKEACSSSGAFKYFGIDRKRAHDAFDDIVATIELYEKLKLLITKSSM